MAFNEKPGYIDNLLAVRGLSSLGVLLSHCLNFPNMYTLKTHLESGAMYGSRLGELLQMLWCSTGSNFVYFFFVHSGYLMGKVFFMGSYQVTSEGIKRFYRGRFLRIAPLLYFNLVFCLAMYANSDPNPLKLLGDVFFVNNLTGRNINPVTWSLSWEMQYYLMSPFVFLLFYRSRAVFMLFILSLFGLLFIVYDPGNFLASTVKFLFMFLIGFSVNPLLKSTSLVKFKWSAFVAIGLFFMGFEAQRNEKLR